MPVLRNNEGTFEFNFIKMNRTIELSKNLWGAIKLF